MFDPKSRYAKLPLYETVDRRGRTVPVVPPSRGRTQGLAGFHLRKQGERTDHYAAAYLDDPAGFWRIAEANDAVLPEQLTEKRELAIPKKRG
ncbi:MAG: hypothetical protein AAGF12_16550 [Myxococcota bacterium]